MQKGPSTDPALFVKTYTAESFLLLSISKCYNKFWCIVTQPVICISAWLSCTTEGVCSVTVARTLQEHHHHKTTLLSSQHGKSTCWWHWISWCTIQWSSGQCSCLAYELIGSYSWVDVTILDHVLCSAWLHNNALVTVWAVQYIHCTLVALFSSCWFVFLSTRHTGNMLLLHMPTCWTAQTPKQQNILQY